MPRLLLISSTVALALALSAPAHAQPSSWIYVGAGKADLETKITAEPTVVQIDAGLGTPPDSTVVVGGLFNLQVFADRGADFGASLRLTHQSFVEGRWGLGLDLGGYQRFWGGGSTGGVGRLVLGAPLGITASLGGSMGSNDHRTLTATIGIDFARLTVHRTGLLNWWPNPVPGETARR